MIARSRLILLPRHQNRVRRPKKHPEKDLQVQCVFWFRKHHKNELLFQVPNEAAFSRAAEFKKMGMLRGASDIVCVLKDRVIFIEFKSEDGTQSREQRIFQQKLERMGYEYYIIKDFISFKNAIDRIG